MTHRNTLLPVLENTIPSFVREDYPRFVSFFKDFIRFLESDGNFLRIAEDWQENREPSLEVGPFIDSALRSLGFESDYDIVPRKSLILHTLRDFYLSRGSEQSFRYLFRALFDTDVSIRYPREELLVPSYAEYGERYYVFTTSALLANDDAGAFLDFVNRNGGVLEGISSKVRASIHAVSVVHGTGKSYLSIEILKPTIDFEWDEFVTITSGDNVYNEQIRPVANVVVDNPGYGYTKGARVLVVRAGSHDIVGVAGYGLIAQTSSGGIDGIQIISPGEGIAVGDYVLSSNTDDGFGFSGVVSQIIPQYPITAPDFGFLADIQILNRGYNYTSPPDLQLQKRVPVPDDPWSIIAVNFKQPRMIATSTEIGQILGVEFSTPFVDYDVADSEVIVIDSAGVGATFKIEPRSYWTTRGWENRRGFLAENSRLIDSDKYQQFSYTVVSDIEARRYNSIVDEYLHPSGYVRTSSIEIVSEASIDVSVGDVEIANPTIIELLAPLVLTYDIEMDIDTPPVSTILVTDSGEAIITDTGNTIEIT